LQKARESLTQDHRKMAVELCKPYARTNPCNGKFVELQNTIDAVDRAIEDEGNPPPDGLGEKPFQQQRRRGFLQI
jgi:pyrimidine deaminase RibD-like protein